MKTKKLSKMLALLIMLPAFIFAQSTIYVAPNGSSGNSGTSESSPTTLQNAINNLSSGGTIHIKGGTYNYSSTISVPRSKNGSSGSLKKVFAYNGTPILNFSSMSESSSNRGIALDASYWHFKDITIQEAGDNGMLLSGNNNKIENCVFRRNHDTGLQLSRLNGSYNSISQWPSNNLILNCESYDNRDSDNEDADGFAAKLTCGTGNIFRGCVAHHNIDDGWDLYTKSDTGPIGAILFEDCIAHSNGSLTSGGSSGGGDKNGYKLGSSSNTVNHIIRRCIAYKNGKHGFTDNGNIGSIEFINCTSYDNDSYNFHTRDGASHIFKNNVSFDNSTNDRIRGNTSAPNSFVGDTGGFTVNSSDFETLSPGSNAKPTSNGFLKPKSGSDLIDAGVTSSDISYEGSKPDLGARESGSNNTGGGDDNSGGDDNGSNTTYYRIQNRGTGLFLDGMGRTTNGSLCGLWANTTHVNAQWEIKPIGSAGYIQFVNRGTGLILDGMGQTSNGSNLGQWANTTHKNSQWERIQSGNYSRFKNRNTGLFLDGMGRTSNGVNVGQWANTTHRNAQWSLISVSSSKFTDDNTKEETTEALEDLKMYPNPVRDNLTIKLLGKSQSNIQLYNNIGQLLLSKDYSPGEHLLNMSDYSAGAYFIKVSNEGKNTIKSIIKQ